MITLEQVEQLSKRTGISYEEAKAVLEETQGNVLDAIILLEKRNRIRNTGSDTYTGYAKSKPQTDRFSDKINAFFKWVGCLIKKGNRNHLVVVKEGREVVSIPVTVLVLLSVFALWLVIMLMVLGLLCGHSFTFRGPDMENSRINAAMEQMSKASNTESNDE